MSNEEPTIHVRKFAGYVPVSCCLLADSGGPPCEHPPAPRAPWRKRAWWRMQSWWYDNRPRVHRGPCRTEDDW